jgi:hypothetical protein
MVMPKHHLTQKEKTMTLFWQQTGPLMKYDAGLLQVEDLNPQMKTQWRMSRMEMLVLGIKCLWAAIKG